MPSPSRPSYDEAISYINRFQFHGFRLGLERMEAILEAMGHPEQGYPVVHVAGTNGKGSVCATLTSILSAAGFKVGLYTSPHLVSLRERFRIGDTWISEKDLARLIWRLRGDVEAGYELSYFEYTTAIAMAWFAEQAVDVAVLETGLGGRLDATNVVRPVVSIITSISTDHQKYLGRTLEEIAAEKAGIIKEGVPVVSGAVTEPARSVIHARCRQMEAPLWELGRDFTVEPEGHPGRVTYNGQGLTLPGLSLALAGEHQMANAALALAAVEKLRAAGFGVEEAAIRAGCREVVWPGRGERFVGSCEVLLDGAHNEDGVRSLEHLLEDLRGKTSAAGKTLLWACSDEGGDKDFAGMLGRVAPLFSHIVVTEPPGPRAPVTLERWRGSAMAEALELAGDWRSALDQALNLTGPGGFLCVAGSLYLVGAVRDALLAKGFARLSEI